MQGAVVIVRNPFDPARDREVHAVAEPATIRQWLDDHGIEEFALPTLCLLDGAPVLRADWAFRPIGPGQVCAFVALPGDGGGGGDDGGGGGGSDPVRIVATIAVLIAAVYLGGALAEAMAITSVAGIAAVTSSVAVVGMALVGAILPPPKPALPSYSWSDTSGIGGGGAGPSPTYSLQGQGICRKCPTGAARPCCWSRPGPRTSCRPGPPAWST